MPVVYRLIGHTLHGLLLLIAIGMFSSIMAQHTVSGRVINEETGAALQFASVVIPTTGNWSITDAEGVFLLNNVSPGRIPVAVQYLGFTRGMYELTITGDTTGLVLALVAQSLELEEVTVTAKKSAGLTTSFRMDRTVLDHLQMLNVTDVTSLLPGGKTNTTLHLATSSAQSFSVSGVSGEEGLPLFGVAVELDGVRLSNNANPDVTGVDVRNIASANIEAIEIITGIPSVAYSDMTNGMVRITTRQGKTPFIVDLATKPNTKHLAVSKGLALGARAGVMNVSVEHTQSTADLTSPYTTYTRNGLSLKYSNSVHEGRTPVVFDIGFTGNLGGYDSESDPDLFVNTYDKQHDHAIRTHVNAKWSLNKRWLTNVEASGGLNYNNRRRAVSTRQSSSASVASVRATEAGYHVGETYADNPDAGVILISPGYWYEVAYDDDRPLNYAAQLKANWGQQFGTLTNNLLLGGAYDYSKNTGRGTYYKDLSTAPTWRAYRYNDVPAINNYGLYLEDAASVRLDESELQMVAGVRTDITSIRGSEYGVIANMSPRANVKYIFWEKPQQFVEYLAVKAGWGKTVKLPAFSVLYPSLNYKDVLTFAPGTTSSGTTYYAYYTIPSQQIFNDDLKWSFNIKQEMSVDVTLRGFRLSLIVAQDRMYHTYSTSSTYTPFTYKFTSQESLEDSAIPIEDRAYSVDPVTGIVTVTDVTGANDSETLSYQEITRAIQNTKTINEAPVTRRRVSWIAESPAVRVLQTSFRVDGDYYTYQGYQQALQAYMPASVNMSDGRPYRYIGYYVGGAQSSNGSITRALNMNVTSITHINALKLIVSLRLECSLYNYKQYRSDYSDGTARGFVLGDKDDYVPLEGNIYDGDQYVGLYPAYYVSFDDMDTKIPFRETYLLAKENDATLYNDLSKLVVKSNTSYFFNPNRTSAYFSGNLSVTKEIGHTASVSFNATNFVNNLATVDTSWNDGSVSLFGNTSYIPQFYYGLSLRLKL